MVIRHAAAARLDTFRNMLGGSLNQLSQGNRRLSSHAFAPIDTGAVDQPTLFRSGAQSCQTFAARQKNANRRKAMREPDLQMLLDERAIQRKLTDYTRGADRMDRKLYESVYWPDATDDH